MTPQEEFARRTRLLQDYMSATNVDLVALSPGPDLQYLLGFSPHADERLCVMLVGRSETHLIVPSVNADQVSAHTSLPIHSWKDESGPDAVLQHLVNCFGRPRTMAVADTMRADILLPLRQTFEPQWIRLASQTLGPIRVRKSDFELERLVRAAEMTDRAVGAGFDACEPGATETDVARAVEHSFETAGAEHVDFTIIASGPNSAYPHHLTSRRRLHAGETVLIDIGATLHGYKSDITRMAHLGEPSDEFRRVYDAVLAANQAGRDAVKPGARARDVDAAARGALAERQLDAYFVHRTGHGLGLDVHEPPYITSDSDTPLEPGMVFTVEPGVYLPGRFGVRIEDVVVVTETGSRILTGAPRDLVIR